MYGVGQTVSKKDDKYYLNFMQNKIYMVSKWGKRNTSRQIVFQNSNNEIGRNSFSSFVDEICEKYQRTQHFHYAFILSTSAVTFGLLVPANDRYLLQNMAFRSTISFPFLRTEQLDVTITLRKYIVEGLGSRLTRLLFRTRLLQFSSFFHRKIMG